MRSAGNTNAPPEGRAKRTRDRQPNWNGTSGHAPRNENGRNGRRPGQSPAMCVPPGGDEFELLLPIDRQHYPYATQPHRFADSPRALPGTWRALFNTTSVWYACATHRPTLRHQSFERTHHPPRPRSRCRSANHRQLPHARNTHNPTKQPLRIFRPDVVSVGCRRASSRHTQTERYAGHAGDPSARISRSRSRGRGRGVSTSYPELRNRIYLL